MQLGFDFAPKAARPIAVKVDKATAIYEAAQVFADVLAGGAVLKSGIIRQAMDNAFAGTDAAGAWIWKDAYEAAEVAAVLCLKGGRVPLDLHHISKLAMLEPSQTRRSAEQVRLQQFSTPLPYAFAAATAAQIGPADVVLEPSAGLGALAVMASGAATLHLNEIADTRADLLQRAFPSCRVTRHNAEHITDFLPTVRPDVVLMNPPFSRTPGVKTIRRDADLRHIKAAYDSLAEGGRLVAITSEGCRPQGGEWNDMFQRTPLKPRLIHSVGVHGSLYQRRGTSYESRLTVLDKAPGEAATFDPARRVADLHALVMDVMGIAKRGERPAPIDQPTPAPAPAAVKVTTKRTPARVRDEAADAGHWDTWRYLEAVPAPQASAEDATGPFARWPGAVLAFERPTPHPTTLVQSVAMAAVRHPVPDYRPPMPVRVLDEGLLSDAQMESVCLAGQAHAQLLPGKVQIGSKWETVQREGDDASEIAATGETLSGPVEFRQGWFLGDGTGAGKGRQVAGILADNWAQGRTRAVWLSQSSRLLEDARRDVEGLGGNPDIVFPLSRYPMGRRIDRQSGILFCTYATLRQAPRDGKKSRLEQIVEWLAGDGSEEKRHAFEGCIVFDESHALANAAGKKASKGEGERGDRKPSEQGRAGMRLQNALPWARVVYVSATGATTIDGLSYAVRLGLWGTGGKVTPFGSRGEFVDAMEAGGIAALEVVARDLKALGLYQARALSYEGVEVDILEHDLSEPQRAVYDQYAEAFKIIHKNLNDALEATGVVQDGKTLNRDAKSVARSVFEGMKQRFFGSLLNSMKCPTLLNAIERDLEEGKSAVVQLVSTGESLMERRLDSVPPDEYEDLNVDLTPRDGVVEYLRHAFPVQLMQVVEDEEGHRTSVPVFDEDGNRVLNQEAVAMRDALIFRLAALPPTPTALDQLVQWFGHDRIAEITGRGRRILKLTDTAGDIRFALRPRTASANLTEAQAFMDGEKRVLVFSNAGGIGRSYHADQAAANTQRRIHYLLEPGWRADQAIQGLGRTHRTRQASAPIFRPVTTDVKGERRFISTIARRLGSLGALTRGQRNSQADMGAGQSLFHDRDDLESRHAKRALKQFFVDLYDGRIKGWSCPAFEDATGLAITYEQNDSGPVLKDELPPMSQFLNRLLALPLGEQNDLFSQLEERIDATIEYAKETGTFELGVESLRGESIKALGSETLWREPVSGATTNLVEVEIRNKVRIMEPHEAIAIQRRYHRSAAFYINKTSGRAAVVHPTASVLTDKGFVPRVRLVRPTKDEAMSELDFRASTWRRVDQDVWLEQWKRDCEAAPEFEQHHYWLATGMLLPTWDKLPSDAVRVRRLTTDDGEAYIGRLLDKPEAAQARRAFGIAGETVFKASEVMDLVLVKHKTPRLVNGYRLVARRVMGRYRVEVEGRGGMSMTDYDTLTRMGCAVEIIEHRTRAFIGTNEACQRVVERWPIVNV